MRIGIVFSKKKKWIGGEVYLKNFSGIVESYLKENLKLYLLSDSNKQKNKFNKIIYYKNNINFFNFFYNFNLKNIILKNNIDIIYETDKFLGFSLKKKIITWIPDFQHKYYPKFFSFINYWKREISFWLKIKTRKRILVSSYTAKKDCLKFYHVNSKKICVAPFAIDLNPGDFLNKKNYLKKKYKINKNYFYVPNQFWQHKNHDIIFKFLDRQKNNKKINKLPQFILTGLPHDYRNKKYSNKLLNKIKSKKYNSKIRYLGLVPLNDVYILNANSLALINPSLFEGWSTTVEEAKSLGSKLILSNIKIHKEQAPEALFFNPKNVVAFENCIIKFLKTKKKAGNLKKITQYTEQRKRMFAQSLLKAFDF